ncbi:MAG: PilT/PilU family type 4a pilus ATPase [Chromatiaceae bacterium]
MNLDPFLKFMAAKHGSDLFFSEGARPHLKVDGTLLPFGDRALTSQEIMALAHSVMDEGQQRELAQTWECNLGVDLKGAGRFRVNVFRQRGGPAMVIRYIKDRIPTFEELSLPPVLGELISAKRGLLLVVGASGSGKSSTLAAMIDYRNRHSRGHILTIEDPIEFTHEHQKSIVNQREVGIDTLSYEAALKNAMREAPDVILIGEIRDAATMRHALAYAETGDLCVSTLHANNANQAIDRILSFFPENHRHEIRMNLALNLLAVVSQRLIPARDGGRALAVEVMRHTRYISDLILKGEIEGLKEAMRQSDAAGMQTFDMSLYQLYTRERITLEEALANADSRNDLALRIRLEGADGRGAAPPMNYQPHPALEPLDVALYRPEPKPAQ